MSISTTVVDAATTTAASVSTGTSSVVSWFVLVALLGIWVLYWVLASSRVAGLIVSALCNRFLLSEGETVSIGAVNFSFVQGRLAFGSLTYTSKNMSVSVVTGFVTLRYWRKDVQRDAANAAGAPPRMDLELTGVELQFFNNSGKFAQLDELIRMRKEHRTSQETPLYMDGEPQKYPWYFNLVAATAITIVQGSLVVAARDALYQTAVTFRVARGLLLVEPRDASSSKDLYRMSLTMELTMAEVTSLAQHSQKTTPGKEHKETAGWTFGNKFVYSKCWDNNSGCFVCAGAEQHIMRTPRVKLLYVQDEGGIIGADGAYSKDDAPLFSMRVRIRDAVINFGAWANYQRALQQYRFFPEDWKTFEEKLFHPRAGVQRVCGYFNMNVQLSLSKDHPHTIFRIPYRRPLYPCEEAVGDVRPYAAEWLEVQASKRIDITYRLPWVTLAGDKGSAHEFRIAVSDFKPCIKAIASFTRKPLLQSKSLVVEGRLFSDNDWRNPALWSFDIALGEPEIWLLYDHVNMFTDLVRSWTSPSFSMDPHSIRGVDYHYPILYTIHFTLENSFSLWLNANEFNIIDVHNDPTVNTYFLLQGHKLAGTIDMPFIDYGAPKTRIPFDISVSDLHVRLKAPHWHTVTLLLEEPPRSNFISVVKLRLLGDYTYCAAVAPDLLDVLRMDVELTDPSCLVYAFYLKQFLSLKNNYLGAFQNHMSSATFEGWNPVSSTLGHARRAANPLDASVTVHTKGPVSLAAAVDMYSSDRNVVATFQYLTIEVRSHASFLSLQLDISPISLSIPFANDDVELRTTIAQSLQMDSNSSLEVEGFSLGFYLHYGPEPRREVYRERFRIHVGAARGRIVAGQVFSVVSLLQNLFHHFYTWENETHADINAYNREIKRGKLRSLMEVDVQITGLELYVAMIDTLWHLSSTDGCHIHYDTRHNTLYTDTIHIRVPPVQIMQYLPLTEGRDGVFSEADPWTDVANIQVGVDIRLVSKRDTWLAEMRDQNAFIAENDAGTQRCLVYLQQVAANLEQAVAQSSFSSGGLGPGGDAGSRSTRSPSPPSPQSSGVSDATAREHHKRCGRLYTATLSSADDNQAYASDPLIFKPKFEANTVADLHARVLRERAAQGRGQTAPSLPPSRGPTVSRTADGSKARTPFDASGQSFDGVSAAHSMRNTLWEELNARIRRLTDELEVQTYGHVGASLERAEDQETTTVIIQAAEGAVIAFSPNTLSSVHGWLTKFGAEQKPAVNAYWDSLQIAFMKRHFFVPKHRFDILQVSVKVPPLRVEVYSSLGENLMASALISDVSLCVHLDEEKNISGEEAPPPIAPFVERRRGLTALVKVDPLKSGDDHVASPRMMESVLGGVSRTSIVAAEYSSVEEKKSAGAELDASAEQLQTPAVLEASSEPLLKSGIISSGEIAHKKPSLGQSAINRLPGLSRLGRSSPSNTKSSLETSGGAAATGTGGGSSSSVTVPRPSSPSPPTAATSRPPPSSSLEVSASSAPDAAVSPRRRPSSSGHSSGAVPIPAAERPPSPPISPSHHAKKASSAPGAEPPQLRKTILSPRKGTAAKTSLKEGIVLRSAETDEYDDDSPLIFGAVGREAGAGDAAAAAAATAAVGGGGEGQARIVGKAALRKLKVSANVKLIAISLYECTEITHAPSPVLQLELSGLQGTLFLTADPALGRVGAGRAGFSRIEINTDPLLAQNIPQLLVNWYFPVGDLVGGLETFLARRKTQLRLLVAGALLRASLPSVEHTLAFPSILHRKASLCREAWFPIFVLRRNWRADVPPAEMKWMDHEVSTQLKEAPPMDSSLAYWDLLRESLQSRPSLESVRFLLDHPDVVALFDEGDVLKRQWMERIRVAEKSETASRFDLDALLTANRGATTREDALEVDVVVEFGSVTIHDNSSYEMQHSFLKARGVSGKGKLIWARTEGRRRKNAKVYAELVLKRISGGVMNSLLQYVVVYERSVGNWITTRAIGKAKRALNVPVPSEAPAAVLSRARPPTAAAAAAAASADHEATILEIVSATVHVEPVRIQAVSDHGSVLVELDGGTAVYSHLQSFASSKYKVTESGLQHFSVLTVPAVRASLYGTANPDGKARDKGRIAEICLEGLKMSELMLKQRNTVNKNTIDFYNIALNVRKIDVPFQVGNARDLGNFFQEWTLAAARETAGTNMGWADEDFQVPVVRVEATSDEGRGGVPLEALPALSLKVLISGVHVHTGNLVALDFSYEIPRILLEVDHQNDRADVRFSIPRHMVCFNSDGKTQESLQPSPRVGEEDGTGSDPIADLFAGRYILLPNISFLGVLERKFDKRQEDGGGESSDESARGGGGGDDGGGGGGDGGGGGNDNSADVPSGFHDDQPGGGIRRLRTVERARKLAHANIRVTLGRLEATIRTDIMNKALAFLVKLEKQVQAVSEVWLATERRKLKTAAHPRQETLVVSSVQKVKIWYQVHVIFSGIRVKVESPDATALVRLSDLSVNLGNDLKAGPKDEAVSSFAHERHFRDLSLTFRLPELSVWLLEKGCAYEERALDIVLLDPSTATQSVLFAFMTHITISNLYSFNKMQREYACKLRQGGARGADVSDSESGGGEGGGDVGGALLNAPNNTVADMLQTIVVTISNTAFIMQPRAVASGAGMATFFLKSALDFRRSLVVLVEEKETFQRSERLAKDAAATQRRRKMEQARAAAAATAMGEETADTFLQQVLQSFTLKLDIENLAIVVPFRNYHHHYSHMTSGAVNAPSVQEQYSYAALTLDQLKLQGTAGSAASGRERLSSKLIARADLRRVRAGFGEGCDSLKFARTFQHVEVEKKQFCSDAVPLINSAEVAAGGMSMYGLLSQAGLEKVAVEVKTSGLVLEVNPALYSHWMLLRMDVQLAHERVRGHVSRSRGLVEEIRETGVQTSSGSSNSRLPASSSPATGPPVAEPPGKLFQSLAEVKFQSTRERRASFSGPKSKKEVPVPSMRGSAPSGPEKVENLCPVCLVSLTEGQVLTLKSDTVHLSCLSGYRRQKESLGARTPPPTITVEKATPPSTTRVDPLMDPRLDLASPPSIVIDSLRKNTMLPKGVPKLALPQRGSPGNVSDEDEDDVDDELREAARRRVKSARAPPSLSPQGQSPSTSYVNSSTRPAHHHPRNLSINFVFRVETGMCNLFLAKDGLAGGHAKSLHEFKFPGLVVRLRHEHQRSWEGGTKVVENMSTHLMAVLDKLDVRLPPSVLELGAQGAAQVKRFSKLMRECESRAAVVATSSNSAAGTLFTKSPRKMDDEPAPADGSGGGGGGGGDLHASDDEISLAELLNVEGNLGLLTIALSFKGIQFQLDCQPVTEVFCTFNLGRLDLFLSSSEEQSRELFAMQDADEDSYLSTSAYKNNEDHMIERVTRHYLNTTLHLELCEVKIHNQWVQADTVGIAVYGVSGNVGRRLDVLSDGSKDSVVSGFLGLGGVECNFSMTSLKSWFVVQNLWLRGLKNFTTEGGISSPRIKGDIAGVSTPPMRLMKKKSVSAFERGKKGLNKVLGRQGQQIPSSGATASAATATTTTTTTTSGAEQSVSSNVNKARPRVTVLVGAHVSGIAAKADMSAQVGSCDAHLGSLCVRMMLPLGSIRQMKAESKVRVNNPLDDEKKILFVAEIALQQIVAQFDGKLTGSFELESLLCHAERNTNALTCNSLEAVLQPLHADLSYKGSQILFVDTGELKVELQDAPEGSLGAKLGLRHIRGYLSAETITQSSFIVRRLADSITKSKGDAKILIAQSVFRNAFDREGRAGARARQMGEARDKGKDKPRPGSEAFVRPLLERLFDTGKGAFKVLDLNLTIEVDDVSVALFADVMKDPLWIQLTVSTLLLVMDVKSQKLRESAIRHLEKNLLLSVNSASVVRMTESEGNEARNWVRPSRSDSILEFPRFALGMDLRQPCSGPNRYDVECKFNTQFSATIMVTLRVELYAFLNDLADTLKSKLETIQLGSDVGGRPASKKTTAKTESSEEGLRKPITLVMKQFTLDPRINVLENLTPFAVQKVFELLKIGDPQTMIPRAVHETLVANTEKILFILLKISQDIEALYEPKKKKITPSAAMAGTAGANVNSSPAASRIYSRNSSGFIVGGGVSGNTSPRKGGSAIIPGSPVLRSSPKRALSRVDFAARRGVTMDRELESEVFTLLQDDDL